MPFRNDLFPIIAPYSFFVEILPYPRTSFDPFHAETHPDSYIYRNTLTSKETTDKKCPYYLQSKSLQY